MNFYALGQLSPEEKNDILSKHKHLYNGYRSMYPDVSNTQPLYVQDFANDKDGLVVNNKGEVKKYTNVGINEQVESKEVCDECGAMEMSESSTTCNECGGMMMEGECMECGWKGGQVMEYEDMEEDIYDIEDLNPEEGFDYVEPKGSNRIDTFKLRKEQGTNYDYIEPAYDFESDGPGDVYPVAEEEDIEEYEPMESAWSDDLDEVDISGSQGIYSDMEPPYDFDSEGPGKAGPYQRSSYNEEDMEEEWNEELEEGWDEVDEDIHESFIAQKNKINEMMQRMKIIK